MAAGRILIVDDEVCICNALRRSFMREGYTMTTFTNPHEACHAIAQLSFDAVIADYFMPQMTGLIVLEQAMNAAPDALRILLTGQTDMQIAQDALQKGIVHRFFAKPWDESALKEYLALNINNKQKSLL